MPADACAWPRCALAIVLAVTGAACAVCPPRRAVPLERAVAVPALEQACPPERADELCAALRGTRSPDRTAATGALERARAAAARAAGERNAADAPAPWDPALGLYVRERALGLFAWHVVTAGAAAEEPDDYAARAAAVLAEHFPTYPAGAFPIATLWLPPGAASCTDGEMLLVYPGVARILARDEFADSMAALRAHFPCLAVERADTPSFAPPAANAARGYEALARHGDAARVHLLGYSQGGLTALQMLVAHPDVARRTRTVVLLNVPAHGSELGDVLSAALQPAGWFDWLWAGDALPEPFAVSGQALAGLGPSTAQLEEWLRAEGAPDATFADFVASRRDGVRSLGTGFAHEFWQANGAALPRAPLYVSLRSIVTDPRRNLPPSNAAFYQFLSHRRPDDPHNDMQVRLSSQQLGGPLAAYEVLGAVTEGNHWQWALATGDVPDAILPRDMTDRVPRRELLLAYYETFGEVGLLGR